MSTSVQGFNVPTKEEVAAGNQAIFDNLQKGLGFIPNLYAVMAHSENALGNYLQFQGGKTSLSKKEKEVINLVVSQVNGCRYCQSAHTAVGKMNGFSDEQVLEIRKGTASFDAKLDALARFTKEVTENKGNVSQATLDAFFSAGYTKENYIDTILVVADKIVMNYIFAVAQVPIDFPAVPEL